NAWYNLGNALAEQQDLPGAIAAYRQATQCDPKHAKAWYSLGNALRAQKDLPAAVEAYQKAIHLDVNDAEAHCNLGLALSALGELAGPRKALQQGHELGNRRPHWPYPSATWVKRSEQLPALEKRLPEVLQGAAARPGEQVSLAGLCLRYKQRYADAARLYAAA